MRQSLRINQYIFQSTLSMRRATAYIEFVQFPVRISIHALHEESDWWFPAFRPSRKNFNPRSP